MTDRLLRLPRRSGGGAVSTVVAEGGAAAQRPAAGAPARRRRASRRSPTGARRSRAMTSPSRSRSSARPSALDPKLNDAYWRLAAILYGKKKYTEAVELLRRAPDQTDIDVREQLGLALYKTATPPPAEAIRLLEDVVAEAARLVRGAAAARAVPRAGREPQARRGGLEMYLKYRPPSAASLDPQVHMVLGTALRLRQGVGPGAEGVRGRCSRPSRTT